jgi:hypothetical protein
MTLTTFVNTYLGKKVDFDKEGTPQCVDLARQYIKDVLNMPQPPALGVNGGAKDMFDKPGSLCVTVDSATAAYSKGDILIWNSSKTNKYGHVAILLALYDTKYFLVLEQDGFKKDGVKIAWRSRENLRGCLWKPNVGV